jgi:predicted N-formylglutamate amidohydrolase
MAVWKRAQDARAFALRRKLQNIQVEFRQDEMPDLAAQRCWARRLGEALIICNAGKLI